jgi:hypothetical protein
VVTLRPDGTPSAPFATRMIPPQSRMGPLTDAEMSQRMLTPQVRKYAEAVDRESAREKLEAQYAATDAAASSSASRSRQSTGKGGTMDTILGSSVARSALRTAVVAVTGTLVRGMLGSLLGTKRRGTTRRR